MTTVVDFAPSASAPFQFNPTLDGQIYSARVTWGLFSQRYFLELSALDGTLVFNQALEGSPVGIVLQELSWSLGRITASTSGPHGYRVGTTLKLTISGVSPDGYNGTRECLVSSPTDFSYPEPVYPGSPMVLGRVDYNLNLAGGYFTESTLVFREPSRQFEITP